ncbi:MAG TPA: VOC family protein, partial [Burkholderiales bacterium]|nr:VOC family protein [Burkholderiales bacterium]
LDFGLVRAQRTADALYMRGTGSAPYCYVARKAERHAFAGVAMRAASAAEFEAAARIPGAHGPRPIDAPGGGMSISLRDPDGIPVEVVYGIAPAQPLPMREPLSINYAREKHRRGGTQRISKGPAQILRLGHVLFFASDFNRTRDWWRQYLGMLTSDTIHAGTEDNKLGGFLRCDRGAEFTDHHTIALFGGPVPKLHHCSFEIQDFDAQVLGNEWLTSKGYKHAWGIGRHTLGSQIFDYWYDPYGVIMEHYADGDVFDASKPAESHHVGPDSLFQWGPPVPEVFLR